MTGEERATLTRVYLDACHQQMDESKLCPVCQAVLRGIRAGTDARVFRDVSAGPVSLVAEPSGYLLTLDDRVTLRLSTYVFGKLYAAARAMVHSYQPPPWRHRGRA